MGFVTNHLDESFVTKKGPEEVSSTGTAGHPERSSVDAYKPYALLPSRVAALRSSHLDLAHAGSRSGADKDD
jgi:hypothetical protein